MNTDGPFPFRKVSRDDVDLVEPSASGLRVLDADGRAWQTRITSTIVEEPGPVRTTITQRGELWDDREQRAALMLRMHFYAGLGTVRFEITLHNPRRAVHPDGYWDLGDPGSIHLREVSFSVAAAHAGEIAYSLERGHALLVAGHSFALQQTSSGGDCVNSPVHITADRSIPAPPAGYQARTENDYVSGRRATPVVVLGSQARSLGLAVPQFWQNFPKAIEADSRSLTLHLFPRTEALPHELQGGEQKTHVFFVAFGEDLVTEVPLEWVRAPIRARVDPAAYSAAGGIPPLAQTPHPKAGDYNRLIAPALEGGQAFEPKREHIDEYGWRHFGDLYADHETVVQKGSTPLVSHYNNQYDAIAAFAWHFMRTGDWRWWDLMDDLARHVVDIDIYHTTEDRAAFNGGIFWHTNHHVSADTATHRTYPRRSNLPGGGPSNEHNYTTGLLLHHCLTGSPASAEAVIGLARWVTIIDDGAQSRFRWIDRGPSGGASATYSYYYHGPGRGAGNSINALIDGHRLSRDARHLDFAEQLIRRCIHPADDPAQHDLLDAERRWSYTVFLQVLGKYVDYKSELRQLDDMRDYAREALLTYARWMAVHEVPYLDHQDRLEFPTETWAAQDLRKADVFHTARRYAQPDEEAALASRRDWFFARSVDTLLGMPTASFTRPLVLLLSNGFRVAFADEPLELATHSSPRAFAPPVRFRPIWTRVCARLAVATVAGFVMMAILLIYLFSQS